MKTIILIQRLMSLWLISLLLFLSVNAQNVWYVDRDATGSANGTSWANAWRTISSSNQASGGVNYSSISPGDTIYISGGADSTLYRSPAGIYANRIYPSGAGITYASGNPVVICPSWEAGHNGQVYIGAKDNTTQWILQIHNISNIKLTGFNFVDNRTASHGTMLYLGGAGADGLGIKDSLITIENSHIVGTGIESMIYLNGYKVTIRNCLIEQAYNSLINDQDPFGIAGGRGGHIIEGNKIIYRNDATVGVTAHRDILQYSDFGDSSLHETVDIIIRNNLLLAPYNAASWNALIYSSNPRTNVNWYIYNNILVSNNTASSLGGIFTYQPDIIKGWTHTQFIFNNTIIMNDDGTGLSQPFTIQAKYIDTLVIKNNVVVMDAQVNGILNIEPFSYMSGETVVPRVYYRDVDYNAYYEYGGIQGSFYSGERYGAYSLAQWLASAGSPDAHSLFGNSTAVTFVNKYGEDLSDYYTTTGRGLGVNLSTDYPDLVAKFPDLAYDILGNPRGSSWDIGALEYQGTQSNNINVKSKIFLQGPFNTNSMNTNLTQILPSNQPFNTAPWNYNGSESLSSGSSSGYVDWVLVELRNSSNPLQVVSKRAAILKNDGNLLNTDGSTGVPFSNLQAGAYYVAVYHRNHLPIMSANPVSLSANTPIYDFTTNLNRAYIANAGSPMTELAPGKYGMYAGNGNGDYGISIFDKNQVWTPQNGTAGYKTGDFNLNGVVDDDDVFFYNLNNGKVSQMPNTQ